MFINMSVGFAIAAMVLVMLALNVFEPGILANVLYGFSILCAFIAFLGISEYIRWPSISFFDKHSSAFLVIGNLGFIAGYFLSNLEPVFRFALPGISLMVSGTALIWVCLYRTGNLDDFLQNRLLRNPRVPRFRFVLGWGLSIGVPCFIVTVFLMAAPDLAQGGLPDLRVVSSAGAAVGSVIFFLTSWSAWKMHRETVE